MYRCELLQANGKSAMGRWSPGDLWNVARLLTMASCSLDGLASGVSAVVLPGCRLDICGQMVGPPTSWALGWDASDPVDVGRQLGLGAPCAHTKTGRKACRMQACAGLATRLSDPRTWQCGRWIRRCSGLPEEWDRPRNVDRHLPSCRPGLVGMGRVPGLPEPRPTTEG